MAQLGYLGPYNVDRLRPFATRGTRLGGVDELLAQRSAETINKLGLPTTQREDGTMSGPAVIYDGFRTPQDQANAIRSVAKRNRIPWSDSLLRTGIPGMAAPVGRSQHERGRAVDVLEPYVAAFRDNLAPDMRQPLPGSDANHFELVKQAQSVGTAPAGQGDAMAASGNDTMAAAIPGATQPTQAYGGMTPEQADWNRKFGAQLMQMGTSAAPVGHWTQALARVLQGGMGGYMMGSGNRGMAEGQAAGNQALAAALANPSVTPTQYAQTALGNPFTAPQGQKIGQAVIAARLKGPERTSAMKEYEQARNQGFKGSFLDYQKTLAEAKRSQTNINMGGNKFDQEFGKLAAGEVFKMRDDAKASASSIANIDKANELLDSGIISGKGANLVSSAIGWFDTLGIAGETARERLANTQTYAANMGREVGNVIRAFGAGTGLSNADREYAQKIAGGEIELTEKALRNLTAIARQVAIDKIKMYNKAIRDINPAQSGVRYGLEIPLPPPRQKTKRKPPANSTAPAGRWGAYMPSMPGTAPTQPAPSAGTYEYDPATGTLKRVD